MGAAVRKKLRNRPRGTGAAHDGIWALRVVYQTGFSFGDGVPAVSVRDTFAGISTYVNVRGPAFPSIPYFAGRLKKSESTVRRHFKRLEALGILRVERGAWTNAEGRRVRSNRYSVVRAPLEAWLDAVEDARRRAEGCHPVTAE